MTTPLRYKQAYDHCINNQPSWKLSVITGTHVNRTDERIVKEFTKEVIRLAESDRPIKNTEGKTER